MLLLASGTEREIARAASIQAWAAVAVAALTLVLIIVTGFYAFYTKRLVEQASFEREAAAQAIVRDATLSVIEAFQKSFIWLALADGHPRLLGSFAISWTRIHAYFGSVADVRLLPMDMRVSLGHFADVLEVLQTEMNEGRLTHRTAVDGVRRAHRIVLEHVRRVRAGDPIDADELPDAERVLAWATEGER